MARLEVSFDDSIFDKLGKMADVERIAPAMINAALPIIQRAVAASYGALRLGSKLKIVAAKKAKNGGFIGTVTFKGSSGKYYVKGKSRYPLSNAGLAVFKEFGTAAHGNFPATPAGGYISRGVASCESEVRAKMQEVFEQEMGGDE